MGYLRSTDDALGLAPAAAGPVISGAGLGLTVFSTGRELIAGGAFSSTATTVNYVHQNPPPNATFRTCIQEFLISAHHPRGGLGRQQFWFRLSFEHNGYDLRNIAITPLI